VAGLDRAARAAGHRPPHLLSGGGHDAAAFAAAGWDSAMIFLRNWNGSHCPEEGMDPADLAAAVGVLDRFVRDEAAQP
jgi:N-carbamoyl-L-amino-acid hydrolase